MLFEGGAQRGQGGGQLLQIPVGDDAGGPRGQLGLERRLRLLEQALARCGQGEQGRAAVIGLLA